MATATQPPPVEATPKPRPTVGPERHGLPMAYGEFIEAEFLEGWLYELSRGIVIVTQVPGIHHGMIVLRFARLFFRYDEAHPGVIKYQAGGGECRLRLEGMKSDRHPDQAIYLQPYPKGPDLWARWVPEIVVEVVSASGADRDYVLKREEYLAAGVREYWILDPGLRRMLVLINRDGAWQDILLGEDGIHRTELLPDLEVRVGELLGPPQPDEE
jgi:Uma2 family endonuclease